jgi:adenosylhomocysteine nucleosidase
VTLSQSYELKSLGGQRIFYVMAADAEYGPHLQQRLKPLITGIGPVESGTGLAAALSRQLADNDLPDFVVALGSAGSPVLEQTHIYQATTLSYRDMDATALGFEKGQTPFLDLPIKIDLPCRIPGISTATLSTGANIVSGAAYEQIDAEMVDMESFALMRAADLFNIPFISLRGISDGKEDLNHVDDWTQYLHIIDEKLAAAIDAFETAVTSATLEKP